MSSEVCGFCGKKNSTNGIVHLLQQSLFKSQCCSHAQVNSSHWNMIRTLRETFSVFHISPKRQRFLERVLGKCGSISRKEKLKDLGKTRWAERHGYYIIGCTLSESSAAAECSFSGLRRIKSYLRNRMSEKRLSGLAHMHLHLRNWRSKQLWPALRLYIKGKFY